MYQSIFTDGPHVNPYSDKACEITKYSEYSPEFFGIFNSQRTKNLPINTYSFGYQYFKSQ